MSACAAPQNIATSSETRITPIPSSSRAISDSKPLADASSTGRATSVGASSGPDAGLVLDAGRGHVGRRSEQVLRVGAEDVADARSGDVRGNDPGAARGADDDLLPTKSSLEVRVAKRKRSAFHAGGGREHRVEAQRVEPAVAGLLPHGVLEGDELHAPAVELDHQSLGYLPGEAGRPHRRLLLEGRNLGEVEGVAHVHALARERDLAVAVHREVPQRMREGGGRQGQRGDREHGDESLLHRTPSLATGAQRGEKYGLISSASRNAFRAAWGRPRQRSIIPRWKSFRASRVSRRSALTEWARASSQRSVSVERPREHVLGFDAPALGVSLTGAGKCVRELPPPVEIDERRLELGTGAVGLEEALHDVDQLVRLLCFLPAAGGGEGLAEAGGVFRKRDAFERAPVERDRVVDPAVGGVDAGQRGLSAVVIRKAGERLAIRALGGAQSPAVVVEVAELDQRPRGRLGPARGGRDGQLHRLDGTVRAAQELARVRHARVRADGRLERGHAVEGGERALVVPQLDLGVAERSKRGTPSTDWLRAPGARGGRLHGNGAGMPPAPRAR